MSMVSPDYDYVAEMSMVSPDYRWCPRIIGAEMSMVSPDYGVRITVSPDYCVPGLLVSPDYWTD